MRESRPRGASVLSSPLRAFFMAFAGVLCVTFATLLPVCNLLFTCGCTFWGPAHCNIHHLLGPRCPWCAHGNGVFAIAYGLIVLGIAGSVIASLEFRATRGRLLPAFLAGLVGYVLSAIVVGLGSALVFHYPTLFGWKL